MILSYPKIFQHKKIAQINVFGSPSTNNISQHEKKHKPIVGTSQ